MFRSKSFYHFSWDTVYRPTEFTYLQQLRTLSLNDECKNVLLCPFECKKQVSCRCLRENTYIAVMFAAKKRMQKLLDDDKFDDVFKHYATDDECDRRMDGRTNRLTMSYTVLHFASLNVNKVCD